MGEVTPYAFGRGDALRRMAMRSEDAEYRLGYLDGLSERASRVSEASIEDSTVGGLTFHAEMVDEHTASWRVVDPSTGAQRTGMATDLDLAIASCEAAARSMGHPTARMSSIISMIQNIHPELATDQQQRIAKRVAKFITTRGTDAA